MCIYIYHGLCVLMCECEHAHITLCMWRSQDIFNCRSSLSTSFEIGDSYTPPPAAYAQASWPINLQGFFCFCLPYPCRSTGITEANLHSVLHAKTKNLQFYLICMCCGRNNSTISEIYIYMRLLEPRILPTGKENTNVD